MFVYQREFGPQGTAERLPETGSARPPGPCFRLRRPVATSPPALSNSLPQRNSALAHGCARIAHHRTRRHLVAYVFVQRPHERPESARDGRHRRHRWHALAAMFHRPADMLDVHAQQRQVPGEPRLGQHEQRVDAMAVRLADHAEVQPDRHVGKARPLRRAEVVLGDRPRGRFGAPRPNRPGIDAFAAGSAWRRPPPLLLWPPPRRGNPRRRPPAPVGVIGNAAARHATMIALFHAALLVVAFNRRPRRRPGARMKANGPLGTRDEAEAPPRNELRSLAYAARAKYRSKVPALVAGQSGAP